jgi:putative oxidoreductase
MKQDNHKLILAQPECYNRYMITVTSLVLLLVRLVLVVAFGSSSYNKLKDLPKAAKRNEMPLPAITFIAIAEGAAALGLLSGILGVYAAIGLMVLMLGTMSIHIFKWKSPYWAEKGGWEYDLLLFTLSSVIAVLGVGSLAL